MHWQQFDNNKFNNKFFKASFVCVICVHVHCRTFFACKLNQLKVLEACTIYYQSDWRYFERYKIIQEHSFYEFAK